MGLSSIGYFTFDVHLKKRKNLNRDCSVDDVSGGYGVLPYFYSYLSFQKQVGVLKDTKRNRIYGIKEVNRWGDVVVVSVLAGLVGQEVELVNILNGESEGTLDDQHAAARECRLMLACPKGAGLAEFAMEYRDSENASFVAKTFVKQLRKLFPDIQAPINPKVQPEDWVKNGTLEQLSVPLTSVANRVELADGIDGDSNDEVAAVLKVVVEPLSKSGFPHYFWPKMYKSRLKDNAYLELPDIVRERLVGGDVPISATVSSGTQRKSFLIGNEKTPAIREILTSDGEEYLSDRQFAHTAADAMLKHFRDIGFKLKSGWDSGDPEYSLLADDPEWVENIYANNKG